MTEIPDRIIREAKEALGEKWTIALGGTRGWLMRRDAIASAILAAEKRGEERERERCHKLVTGIAEIAARGAIVPGDERVKVAVLFLDLIAAGIASDDEKFGTILRGGGSETMTEIPESVMEEARKAAANIMDNACLGEHWVKNGVDAALRKDIKDAILAAEKRGEERERRRSAERKQFPILGGGGAKIDWQLVQDHGEQAMSNHHQSVEQLASRGGLSWCELHAVLHNRRWEKMDTNEAMITCRALEARYLEAIGRRDWAPSQKIVNSRYFRCGCSKFPILLISGNWFPGTEGAEITWHHAKQPTRLRPPS